MLLIICSKRPICCMSRRQFSCNCWFSLSSKDALNTARIGGIARKCFPPFLPVCRDQTQSLMHAKHACHLCYTTPLTTHSFFLHDTIFGVPVAQKQKTAEQDSQEHSQSSGPSMLWVERPSPTPTPTPGGQAPPPTPTARTCSGMQIWWTCCCKSVLLDL